MMLAALATTAACAGGTLYQFGNPTAEEQAYIEYINRARANPVAEAARLAAATDPAILFAYTYFGVNLTTMQNEISVIPAAQPLAPNAKLTNAARGHSQWMYANGVQTHVQANPTKTTANRLTESGYLWYGDNIGESVAGNASNPWHGHAGFEVDWGPGGAGGMQAGRGHRFTNHFQEFREIGVGVTNGVKGNLGPQWVTQDFAEPEEWQSFGTGVAYYDLNNNNFYDVGEGIGGLNVSMTGVTDYCTSAVGGGWALPIPLDAITRTVTFAGLGINQTRSLVIPAEQNAKVDLKLSYTPPSITSPSTAADGVSHNLAFTAVGGATGYKWNRWSLAPAPAENCDSLANVNTSTTGSYAVLNTLVKSSGTGSFHLANPGTPNTTQSVEFKSLFRGQAAPEVKFRSRLRASMASEKYVVQVKEEGSLIWQSVYSQTGGAAGETAFSDKTVTLTGMTNKKFRLRFGVVFASGDFYTDPGDAVGWFIDSISFTDVSGLSGNIPSSLAGTGSSFTPVAGTYLMSVSPVISGLDFPGGDQVLTVTAPVLTGYAAWAGPIESSNSLATGTIANNPTGDHDKDGRPNLVEYAFGCSPVNPNDTLTRLPAIQTGGTDFKIRYIKDTALTDVTVSPIASMDLVTWKAPGDSGAPAGFTDSLISTTGTLQTREATIPAGAGPGWFVKMKVLKP